MICTTTRHETVNKQKESNSQGSTNFMTQDTGVSGGLYSFKYLKTVLLWEDR